jgi:hypothetical protein
VREAFGIRPFARGIVERFRSQTPVMSQRAIRACG